MEAAKRGFQKYAEMGLKFKCENALNNYLAQQFNEVSNSPASLSR